MYVKNGAYIVHVRWTVAPGYSVVICGPRFWKSEELRLIFIANGPVTAYAELNNTYQLSLICLVRRIWVSIALQIPDTKKHKTRTMNAESQSTNTEMETCN